MFHTLKLSEKVKQTEIEPCVVPLDTTLKNDFDAYWYFKRIYFLIKLYTNIVRIAQKSEAINPAVQKFVSQWMRIDHEDIKMGINIDI